MRKTRDRRVLRALRPIPFALVPVFVLVFLLDLFHESGSPAPLVLLVTDAAAVLVFFALGLIMRRWKIAPRFAHPLSLGVVVMVLIDVLVAAVSTSQPFTISYLSILIVGCGAVMLSLPWLLASIALVFATSVPVASMLLGSGEMRYYGVSFFSSAIVSVIILLSRWNAVSRREATLAEALAETAKRRRVEKSLQESEARLELAIAGTKGGWWDIEMDPENPDVLPDAITFDPTVKSFIGYQDREFANSLERWREQIVPEDLGAHLAAVELHLRGNTELLNSEYRVRHRDGELRWIRTRGRIQRDAEGRPIRWSGINWDVTESKRVREQLGLLTQAVEQSASLILITDKEGVIQYVNSKFLRSTGYLAEEVIGNKPSILRSESTPPEVPEQLWKTVTSGREWQGEFKNKKKDGSHLWVISSVSPIKDSNGVIQHYLAVQEDVTEKRRVEARLAQSQKLESLGRLVSGVAHDFNNLLTAILGFAELGLTKADAQESLQGDLLEIKKAGESASDLTKQLLAFGRRQMLEPKVVNLNDILTGIEELLGRTMRENVELDIALEPELGVTLVDPGQVKQILVNLVVNAGDAMPDGGRLIIETRNVKVEGRPGVANDKPTAGSYVLLTVSDDGVGMDEETQQRAFEPFFTTKPVGRGSGLGLATVYGAVKQSGGYLTLYSEPGHGTTVKIYLPRFKDEVLREASASVLEARGGSEKILLVEDDPGVRRVAALTLSAHGYHVLSCVDAADAERVFLGQDVDLLLTDMVMPGTNGLDLAESLKLKQPALRVVLMSGYTERSVKDMEALGSEVFFLQKPFRLDELLTRVRESLDT